MSESVDHARLWAELDAEVRRRRQSGDLPADFERRLDGLFARLVPVDALGGDFDQLLARAEQSSFVDVLAPLKASRTASLAKRVASRAPLNVSRGTDLAKRVVRKAVSWQPRQIPQQLSALGQALTGALRILDQRLERLGHEVRGGAGHPSLAENLDRPSFQLDHWWPLMVQELGGASGRVLHAEAGGGELVSRLIDHGVDAYGVEPVDELASILAKRGLDVRSEEVLGHLGSLPDGVLAGIVLSGGVDRMLPGALIDLAGLAAQKLAAGGSMVVVSANPSSWARGRASVEAELGLGGPVSSGAWELLMTAHGLVSPQVHDGPQVEGLQAVGDPSMDSNLQKLNELLFPPSTYAVSATRPH